MRRRTCTRGTGQPHPSVSGAEALGPSGGRATRHVRHSGTIEGTRCGGALGLRHGYNVDENMHMWEQSTTPKLSGGWVGVIGGAGE